MLALGLIAALALFLSLKGEVRRQSRTDRARLDELATRVAEAERPAAASGPPVPEPPVNEAIPLRSGMNLSKRVQAVRLLRRGEDVSHVAAALSVTRREVELLIRVQKLSSQRAARATSAN